MWLLRVRAVLKVYKASWQPPRSTASWKETCNLYCLPDAIAIQIHCRIVSIYCLCNLKLCIRIVRMTTLMTQAIMELTFISSKWDIDEKSYMDRLEKCDWFDGGMNTGARLPLWHISIVITFSSSSDIMELSLFST